MTAPVDPARWTVDDDGARWCWQNGRYGYWVPGNGEIAWVQHVEVVGGAKAIVDEANRAIEQAMDAARVHEGCTHTTDTLRQARELARTFMDSTRAGQANGAAIRDLLDLLTAEGPDHG